MKKFIEKTILSLGLLGLLNFAIPSLRAQEPARQNPIAEIENQPRLSEENLYAVSVRDFRDARSQEDIESKLTKERLFNAIIFYRGSEDENLPSTDYFARDSFLKRCVVNFDKSLRKKVFIKYSKDYGENEFPYESSVWDAVGDSLIEKYKFARQADKFVKKVQSAVTVTCESKDGVKYGFSPYVEKTNAEYLGLRGSADLGKAEVLARVCANNVRAAIQTKNNRYGIFYFEWRMALVDHKESEEEPNRQDGKERNKEITWMAGCRGTF
jgi:hypothetical protein